jgi:hypothetical protein
MEVLKEFVRARFHSLRKGYGVIGVNIVLKNPVNCDKIILLIKHKNY